MEFLPKTYLRFIPESSKRPRLDQLPAANLDADDPIDDEVIILRCDRVYSIDKYLIIYVLPLQSPFKLGSLYVCL